MTLSQVTAHFRALSQDPDCPSRLDVLLDLRESATLPTSDQLRTVSEEIRRLAEAEIWLAVQRSAAG